jgi:hypothetical protein
MIVILKDKIRPSSFKNSILTKKMSNMITLLSIDSLECVEDQVAFFGQVCGELEPFKI